LFQSRDRKSWTWPSFRDDEDTAVLADSNGALSKFTPATWRVASYRGALLQDATRILSESPLPSSVKRIVAYVGVNNRDTYDSLLVNHMARFKEVISLQTREVIVGLMPAFEDESMDETRGRLRYNRFLTDLFGESRCLVGLPDESACAPRTHGDRRHLNDDSCQQLVSLLCTRYESLNSTAHPQ